MAYTILNTDGTTLVLLADGQVDRVTTSLSLVGKNVNAYGEYINNNFVSLLANFANTSGLPPRSPLKGQIWYNTTLRRLQVYDNGFKNISGAVVSSAQPSPLAVGDLWFDTSVNQLSVYNGNSFLIVGPAYPKNVGDNGWVVPSIGIKDDTNNTKNVSLLRNYGGFLGIISNEKFTLSSTDSVTYFGTTTSVVAGLTLKGDIKFTGQISSKYLSMCVDINHVAGTWTNVTSSTHANVQNLAIMGLLEKMFPTTSTHWLNEPGIPIGSESRVLCDYTDPTTGTHVRRFFVENNPITGIGWQPYVTTATIPTNVIW